MSAESSATPLIAHGTNPRHIAIIMDGNGRWAQKRMMPRIMGHHAGVKAVRRIVETVTECLEKCNITLDDVKMIVSHQMNARIIESAAKRLEIPDDKIFININEYGNTSAASVPLAFDQVIREGKIKHGDIVILVAFGAGLTWGANVIRF